MNTNELFPKVIGYDKIKSDLTKVLNMIREPEKYKKLGAKLPHGVLLFGPPGTGKTLLCKSFIEAAGLPAYTVRKNRGGDGFFDRDETKVAFDLTIIAQHKKHKIHAREEKGPII